MSCVIFNSEVTVKSAMYGGIGGKPLNAEMLAAVAPCDTRPASTSAASGISPRTILPFTCCRSLIGVRKWNFFGSPFTNQKPDLGAIEFDAAGRRVMHVEVDVLARQHRRADAVGMIVEAAAGHIRQQRREAANRAQSIGLLAGLARNLQLGRQRCSVMRAARRSSGTLLPDASVVNGWPSITSVPGGNVTRLTVM